MLDITIIMGLFKVTMLMTPPVLYNASSEKGSPDH